MTENVYICDRCGKKIEYKKNWIGCITAKPLKLRNHKLFDGLCQEKPKEYDLCVDCAESFYMWVKMKVDVNKC